MPTEVLKFSDLSKERQNAVTSAIEKSGGAFTIKDVKFRRASFSKDVIAELICPSCGRPRQLEMALITPCPGPFNAAKDLSEGGCEDLTFCRPDIKKQYIATKEAKKVKQLTYVSKSKAKSLKKAKAREGRVLSVCAKVREAVNKNSKLSVDDLVKMFPGANKSTVTIQRNKALKALKALKGDI